MYLYLNLKNTPEQKIFRLEKYHKILLLQSTQSLISPSIPSQIYTSRFSSNIIRRIINKRKAHFPYILSKIFAELRVTTITVIALFGFSIPKCQHQNSPCFLQLFLFVRVKPCRLCLHITLLSARESFLILLI